MSAEKWVRVRLASRDLKLLQELTTGEPLKVIADKLHMSRRTARWRVEVLYASLGVTTRYEAIALALRNRWIK